MHQVECYFQPDDADEARWVVVGVEEQAADAEALFDAACVDHPGCAVILRGDLGELVRKRSVLPPPYEPTPDDEPPPDDEE